MRQRLRRLALIAGIAGVPAVGLLAWFWWIPETVAVQVHRAAGARGLEATVADVDLGWSGLSIEMLLLEGQGVRIRVGRLELDGSLVSMAADGASAVEAVRVSEVHVRLTPAALTRLRASQNASSSSQSPSGRLPASDGTKPVLPTIDATGQLEIVDRSGRLLLAKGRIEFADEALQIEEASFEVGDEGADRLEVEGLSAELMLVPEPRLQELSARSTRLRLSAHRRQGETTRSRLRRLLPPKRESPASDDGGETASPRWLDRLADGASIEVRDFEGIRFDGRRLVSESVLEVTRHGEELHLVGRGSVSGGGSMSCDLHVNPHRATGHGALAMEGLPFGLFVPFLPSVPWSDPELTTLSASLNIRAESVSSIQLEGSAELLGLALHHQRLSPNPIRNLDVAIAGQATWLPLQRRLSVQDGRLTMGEATVHLRGTAERTDNAYSGDIHLSLPTTPCDTALGAVPRDLLEEVSGFSWRGRIGAVAHLRLDSTALDDTQLRIRVANGCEFLTVPSMADLRRVRTPFVHRVREPDGSYFEMTTGPGSANWAPIHTVSPFLVHAVVGHEDGAFFRHRGFSIGAIRDALVRNIRAGRYAYGASTITMQLAKNLFLHREKYLARKVQEVLLTWWLESALEKAEILELYLNIIEYGPGVYGIVDAAEHYFGRSPAELSPAESAFLATILPNPKAYYSSYERGELSVRMQARVGRFLRHLGARSRYDEEAVRSGLDALETLRFHRPGEAVALRPIVGRTAGLPFVTAPGQRADDLSPEDTIDDENEMSVTSDLLGPTGPQRKR